MLTGLFFYSYWSIAQNQNALREVPTRGGRLLPGTGPQRGNEDDTVLHLLQQAVRSPLVLVGELGVSMFAFAGTIGDTK